MPLSTLYEKIVREAREQSPAERSLYARRYGPPPRLASRAHDPVSNVPAHPAPDPTALLSCSVRQLAEYARADGFDYFAAAPYLRALLDEDYGCDGEKSVVLYFLSNARGWRGAVARTVKAELRRRFA